jgi:hypothetical protein
MSNLFVKCSEMKITFLSTDGLMISKFFDINFLGPAYVSFLNKFMISPFAKKSIFHQKFSDDKCMSFNYYKLKKEPKNITFPLRIEYIFFINFIIMFEANVSSTFKICIILLNIS